MHRLESYSLWLGHRGDLADLRSVLDARVRAIVDLALNEPVPQLPRDLLFCRFPLVDGAGNDPWMLLSAVDTVANLVRLQVPTLLACSSGLSRSPAIAAAAISVVSQEPVEDCLRTISRQIKHDVNPGFWDDVAGVCRSVYLALHGHSV